MLSEDLAYTLLWHPTSHFLRGDHFPHLSVMFDSITGENQADDKSKRRSDTATCMRGMSSIAASSAQSFPSISDFCVTVKQAGTQGWVMQQHAAAGCCHKSLRVLILRRLKLKTHPDSSTQRRGCALFFSFGFSFVGIYFIFVNFLSFQVCILLRCGLPQSCPVSIFSILNFRFNY